MREWKCRSGKSRSDNVWKAVRTENSLRQHQECRLKRSSLRQFLNNAHEQRPGVHIQTSLLTIIVKDTGYHPISGDKPI